MKQNKWVWLSVLILIGSLFLVSLVTSVDPNHYIRPGASGNNDGTDWTNAWTAHPGTWVRGDTYYYADGTIDAEIVITTAVSGSSVITLKKATAGDHGTETGWAAGYGDGQFIFNHTNPLKGRRVIYFYTDYLTIDGQFYTDEADKSTYGFSIAIPDSANADNYALLRGENGASNCIVDYIAFDNAGALNWEPVEDGYNNKQVCISHLGIGSAKDSWTISNCYFGPSNAGHLFFNFTTNTIVEKSYFDTRIGEPHGEAISWNHSGLNAGNIIRWNKLKDISGTGIIVIKDSIQSGFIIHDNVMWTHHRGTYYTTNAYITNTGGDTNSDMEVYNNSFYGQTLNLGGVQWSGSGTGNLTYNNLFHSCGEVPLTGATIDNNSSEYVGIGLDNCEHDLSGSPYISVIEGSEDFTLRVGSVAQDEGTNLSGIFIFDLAGNTHGADGKWDIGAYEAQGGGASRNAKDFYISQWSTGGIGTSVDAFSTLAQAQDSLTVDGDKLIVRGYIEGQITAQANIIIESDSNPDSTGTISGKVVLDTWVTPVGVVSDSLEVDADDNDGYTFQGDYDKLGSNSIYYGEADAGDPTYAYVRVRLSNISNSADAAYLRIYQEGTKAACDLWINVQDAKSSDAITDEASFATVRADTAAVGKRYNQAVSSGSWEVYDVTSITNSHLSNNSCESGDWVTYVLYAGTGGANYMQGESYEAGGTNEPEVTIYATGGGGSVGDEVIRLLAGAEQDNQNMFFNGTPATIGTVAQIAAGQGYYLVSGDSAYINLNDSTAVKIDGLDFLIKDNAKNVTVNNIALKHAKYGVESNDADLIMHNGIGDTLETDLRATVAGAILENWISLNPYIASFDAADKSNGLSNNYNAANKYLVAGDDSVLTATDEDAVTSGIDINATTYVQNTGSTTIDAGTGNRDGKAIGTRDIGRDETTATSITLTAFNSGLTYNIGGTYSITWTSVGVDSVKIEYNSGVEGWTTLIEDDDASPYAWDTAGLTADSEYQIRISWNEDADVNDISNTFFELAVGADPKSVGIVTLTVVSLLGTGYAAYRRYRGTYRP